MPEHLGQTTTEMIPSQKSVFLPTDHWPKKSRSRIPRIKRRCILVPFVDVGVDDDFVFVEEEAGAEHSGMEAAGSSSSSCFQSAVTVESSLVSSRYERTKKRPREGERQRGIVGVNAAVDGEFRPVTRLYARLIENRKLGEEEEEKESGECSGIGIGSGFSCAADEDERNSKRRFEHDATTTVADGGSDLSISKYSHVSGGFSDGNFVKKSKFNREDENVLGTSLICKADDRIISKSLEITTNFGGEGEGGSNLQLECSEQLPSDGERSAYSSCNDIAVSDPFDSEPFGDSEELNYFSDLSQLLESSDNFSEKSHDDRTPSVAFSLYLEFRKQFTPSALSGAPPGFQPDNCEEFTLKKFENEEDEESYRMFRIREKRIELYDYAEEKLDNNFTEECCEMMLQERLVMVNWMVEHSNAMELQKETLFLGVSLMDRFLQRGFFKAKRNFHLLGIACVALATRLEENQPYNNVRRKSFLVGDQAYGRGEVVGMEWLVQEILSFQCFLPTTYNFLWFYLKAAKAEPKVENLAKYLAALSLLDHHRLRFWPSTVAASLVVLASLVADRDDSCQFVMETHVRTKNDDLPECIKSLEWLVKHAS